VKRWQKGNSLISQKRMKESIDKYCYGNHLIMLEELKFGVETTVHQRLNIPYFLMQSLIEYKNKVKEGNSQ